MNRDDWKRIKDIVAGALAQPEAARPKYVAARCGQDDTLRTEVESLLAATAEAADLYESPSLLALHAKATLEAIGSPAEPSGASAIDAAAFVGRRIGSYRIVREIGSGGMGSVFLAERDDHEYHRRVAIKIARTAQSSSVLKWFRKERQILANLEHPNIARLLDGGTTEDGVPYLVMEYVEGTPIDEYCRARMLTIDQRLALFRQVCAAVEYAHRSLVVHRDLKPRNILVVDGVPKLLDFGIAKLLGPADGSTEPDDSGPVSVRMMTPEYASPEQIRGGPITTATDVFALGVLLYRLLTERSPYRVSSTLSHGLAEAVCEQDPWPPSMVVEDSRSRRRLAGDLDAVVLKALQKDPGARYPTVARLDEDVDRHLNGQPLLAREHTWPYRTAKFAGRHKFGLVAAALLLLTLAGGLGATMWQARQAELQRARAERHFDEVRALASSLIFEIHDGIENLPGAIPTRQLLIERALGYFDSLAADEESNPALQRELASAYDKLADVLGRPYASNLGNSREALNSYRKALAIREKLAAVSPDHQTQSDLWSSYYRVGNLLRETADTGGALAIHRRARDIITGLLRSAPDDPTLVNNAARTAVTMAHTFEQAGMIMESLESARQGLSLDERRLARNESNNAIRADVATGHGRVGIAYLRLGDPAMALEHLRQRVSLAQKLVDAEPGNVAFRRGFSTAQLQLGQALARAGDTSAAIREQLVSLDVRRALADQDPTDRQAQIDVMFANLEIGQTLTRSGDLAGAVEKLRAAVRYCETLTEADPDYVFYRLSLASASTRLSQVLNAQGLAREAAPLAQRAMELMESASAADPADVRLRFEMALAYEAIGDAVAAGAQQPLPASLTSSPARAWYQKSSDVMEQLRQDGTLPGGTLLGEESAKLAAIRQKMIARAAPSAGVMTN